MTPEQLKEKFISYCGEEKYISFKEKLARLSENEYDLRFFQEKLLHDFCEGLNFSISPTEVLTSISDGSEYIYHCPSKGCTFIAICIDYKKDVWSCGECGETWRKKEQLFTEIEKSILKYPYRANIYKKTANGFLPVSPNDYPRKAKRLLKNEWQST